MTDTPASSSTGTQKPTSTAASSPVATLPAGVTDTEQPSPAATSSEPDISTSPYSTKAPTVEELETAKKKAEALLEDKEAEEAGIPSDAKTTVMASGPDSGDVESQKEPLGVEVPEKPQEYAKNGSNVVKVIGLVALILLVGAGVGVGVWRTTVTQETTETRSQAQEPTSPPGPILTEVSDNTTPNGVEFDVYMKLYGDAVDEQWVMTDEASGARGAIYFKYDQDKGEALLFSRWDNLNLSDGTVARLWLVKDGEYTWAGEVNFEYGKKPVVGYGIYKDADDLRTYDSLVLSYDPYDNLASAPRQTLMSVDIRAE